MSYDTLVFLASNHQIAAKAAAKLPRERNLRRMFVFLGDKPSTSDLDWMSAQDLHITLERYIELEKSPIPAGVRAGLLYAGGWGLLFCLAESPPSEDELQLAHTAIQEPNGVYRGHKIWGATRETLVINGFDAIYPGYLKTTDIDGTISINSPDVVSDIDLISAMQGHTVSEAAVVAGLRQVVSLRGVSMDKSVESEHDPYSTLLYQLVTQATSLDDDFPTTLIVGSRVSADHLYNALTRIPKHGSVVTVRDKYNANIFDAIADLKVMRKFLTQNKDNETIEVLVLYSLAKK